MDSTDEITQKTELDPDVIDDLGPVIRWTIRAIADGRFSVAGRGIEKIERALEPHISERLQRAFSDAFTEAVAELEEVEIHRGAAEGRDAGGGRRVSKFGDALEVVE